MRYYLHNRRADDEAAFDAAVATICTTYADAPAQAVTGRHTVSIDEKTGIQAVERAAPTVPMQPGRVERQEFEYVRHGTQCLIANFDVVTGQILTPSIGTTRTEADFAAHVAQLVATDPQAEWVLVMDHLNIHQSETLVRWVAEQEGMRVDLGVKGTSGVLQSMTMRAMTMRAAFLQDRTHRIRIVYTPIHTSWLNQVEVWFSILTRRLLKRGSFTSVEDLRARLLAFIAYFNATLAKPFKWTYRGRPLTI